MYKRGKSMIDSAYDRMSDDECELYRYNIPPKYDGSRFRRGIAEANPPQAKKAAVDLPGTSSAEPTEPCDKPECTAIREECAPEEDGNLLSKLGMILGREEFFIIALALAIADGDGKGDILLLLALLLIAD